MVSAFKNNQTIQITKIITTVAKMWLNKNVLKVQISPG